MRKLSGKEVAAALDNFEILGAQIKSCEDPEVLAEAIPLLVRSFYALIRIFLDLQYLSDLGDKKARRVKARHDSRFSHSFVLMDDCSTHSRKIFAYSTELEDVDFSELPLS